ncbi:hypothetical protein EI94DRAFT_1746853, partial [Lactarius quietus]
TCAAPCPLTTTIAFPPSREDVPMGSPPPTMPRGGSKALRTSPKVIELSVFEVLNIFRRRWFLSRTALLHHAISAQKAEDGNISWVEFSPPFHSHLVKCAVALVPIHACPVPMVKQVMFVFILELLNQEGHLAFFELRKGGRKANNAQKEKRRLAWKRSRAAKRERDREAVKAAQLPPRERQCLGCGCKFNSRKTAKKHKCSKSKVVRTKEAAVGESSSHLVPPTKPNKLAAPIPPPAPTTPARLTRPLPSHSTTAPPVTGVLGGPSRPFTFQNPWDAITLPRNFSFDRSGTLLRWDFAEQANLPVDDAERECILGRKRQRR